MLDVIADVRDACCVDGKYNQSVLKRERLRSTSYMLAARSDKGLGL